MSGWNPSEKEKGFNKVSLFLTVPVLSTKAMQHVDKAVYLGECSLKWGQLDDEAYDPFNSQQLTADL